MTKITSTSIRRDKASRISCLPAVAAGVLVLLVAGCTPRDAVEDAASAACKAYSTWITSPSLPDELSSGDPTFCDFYQFTWQSFLYLVSPANAALRNFQVPESYPILQANASASCGPVEGGSTLFVRTAKSDATGTPFVIPERINQAGHGDTIYDQKGNVVFYDIRFSRNLCSHPYQGNLPRHTTELKTSWRKISLKESSRYFTMTANIAGDPNNPVLLGLVGFHLFRTTTEHPGGVWATFEHKDNAPDCASPQATPRDGWSFTSPFCTQCLAKPTVGCRACQFNAAKPATSLTGTPTEICRVYRDGTGLSDPDAKINITAIDSLNDELVGPNGLLTIRNWPDPMAVWKNYENIGAIWLHSRSEDSTPGNQRGSLKLANSTMETTYQGPFRLSPDTKVKNCFHCHGYEPNKTAITGLSHIFAGIKGQ